MIKAYFNQYETLPHSDHSQCIPVEIESVVNGEAVISTAEIKARVVVNTTSVVPVVLLHNQDGNPLSAQELNELVANKIKATGG